MNSTVGSMRAAVVGDTVDVARQAAVAAAGLATTILVVLANAWLADRLALNILSLSMWLVVPVGAAIGGIVAASGYFIAARVTQTMPSRHLLWSMVLIALSAWFFGHWLEYSTMTFEDGTRVSDTIGFWQFFKFSTEHQSLTVTMRGGVTGINTGELGALGYARELLQVLGFACGGLAAYVHLSQVEACKGCQRYARVTGVMQGASADQFDRGLDHLGIQLPGIVDQAKAALGQKMLIGMNLHVAQCPKCHSFWLRPEVIFQSGRDSNAEKLGRYDIEPSLAGKVLALPAEYRSAPK